MKKALVILFTLLFIFSPHILVKGISADSMAKTTINDSFKVIDKEFESLISELDKHTKNQIRQSYQKQKKKISENIEDKLKEKMQNSLKGVFRKNKNVKGYLLTRKYIKYEKHFSEALKIAEKIASGDDIGSVAWEAFESNFQKKALDAATTLFPPAKPIYYMLRFAYTEYEQLLKEIHDSSVKGLVKQMIADEQLHRLSGKLLDDHLLQVYLKFGKTMNKGIALEKNKNGQFQYQDKDQHNTMTIRYFMNNYGKKVYKHKNIQEQIGYNKSQPLHDQRKAVAFVMRQFYQQKVSPIVKKKTKAKTERKKLKSQLQRAKIIMKAVKENKVDIKIANEASEMLKTWIKEILPEYKEKPVKPNSVTAKKYFKDVSDQETRNEISNAYRKLNKRISKYLSTFNKSLHAVAKNDYGNPYNWHTKSIEFIGYRLKHRILKQLQLEAHILYQLEYLFEKNTFSSGLNSSLQIESSISRIDKLLSKPIIISKKVHQFDLQAPDLSKSIEQLDQAAEFYKAYKWELEAHLKKINAFPDMVNKDIENVKLIKYLGYKEKDDELQKTKQNAFNYYKKISNSINSAIMLTEQTIENVNNIETVIQEAIWEINDYEKDLEGFDDLLNNLNGTLQKIGQFKPSFSNANQFNTIASNYESQIDALFEQSAQIYDYANIPFPFDKEFITFIKSESLGSIEAEYNRFLSGKYHDVQQAIKKDNIKNQPKKFIQLSENKELNNFKYPLFEDRPLNMTQAKVTAARIKYEKKLNQWFKKAEQESVTIDNLSKKWNKDAKIINATQKQAKLQKNNVSLTPEFWKSKMEQSVASKNESIKKLNDMVSIFKTKKKYLIKEMKKAKSKIKSIDRTESKRIIRKKSQLRLMKLKAINTFQKKRSREIDTSKSYYNTYLRNDMGKAKAMYLYFTNVLKESLDKHNNAEQLFLEGFNGSDINKAENIFSEESDWLLKLTLAQAKMEEQLQPYIVNIDELKQYSESINTNRPIQDIINGKLDSDNDGIPDNKELDNSNNPIHGQSIITMQIASLSLGQWINLSTNLVSMGISATHEIGFDKYGRDGLHAGFFKYLGTAPNAAVPEKGYPSNAFAFNLNPNGVYAINFLDGYYAKIQIISYTPGTSIRFRYWFKTDGGIF
jgi:hypothetical protein